MADFYLNRILEKCGILNIHVRDHKALKMGNFLCTCVLQMVLGLTADFTVFSYFYISRPRNRTPSLVSAATTVELNHLPLYAV